MNRRQFLKLSAVVAAAMVTATEIRIHEMSFSELLVKVANGRLDEGDKETLRRMAEQLEQVSSLVSSWVVPGSSIPFIRDLRAENISITSAGGGNVVIDEDGIKIYNKNDTNDSFLTFYNSDNTEAGRIFTGTLGNLELRSRGVAGEERKLILRAQVEDGLTYVSTLELIANYNNAGLDYVTFNADQIEFTTSSGGGVIRFNGLKNNTDTYFYGTGASPVMFVDADLNRLQMGGNLHFVQNAPLFTQVTGTPGLPSPNDWRIFFKSDGMYYVNSAGTVTGPLT